MKSLTRLVDRLLFGSPSPAPRLPMLSKQEKRAALADLFNGPPLQPPFARMQEPPITLMRYECHSPQEHGLLMLAPFLFEQEKQRYLARMLPAVEHYAPWTAEDVPSDLWKQLTRWTQPLVIHSPTTMPIEGFDALITAEFMWGLMTYRTPLSVLPPEVRTLWLSHHGRRIDYLFRALEQSLGSRRKAMEYVWWIIKGL